MNLRHSHCPTGAHWRNGPSTGFCASQSSPYKATGALAHSLSRARGSPLRASQRGLGFATLDARYARPLTAESTSP
jgi:hypothetical protein